MGPLTAFDSHRLLVPHPSIHSYSGGGVRWCVGRCAVLPVWPAVLLRSLRPLWLFRRRVDACLIGVLWVCGALWDGCEDPPHHTRFPPRLSRGTHGGVFGWVLGVLAGRWVGGRSGRGRCDDVEADAAMRSLSPAGGGCGGFLVSGGGFGMRRRPGGLAGWPTEGRAAGGGWGGPGGGGARVRGWEAAGALAHKASTRGSRYGCGGGGGAAGSRPGGAWRWARR